MLEVILEDKFLQHIMKLAEELFNRLNETSNSFEYVLNI